MAGVKTMQTLQLSTSTGKGKVVDIEYFSISNTIMVICHDFAYKITDIDRSTAYFLAPEHYKKLAAYKSVAALVKYAQANQIQPPAETSCPVPAPVPAKFAAKGRGILIERNSSAPCASATANVPYDGNGNAGTSQLPLFIDTETTGISRNDEIVEIAIVDINENILFQSLVKPSKPIPKKATDIHGITNKMVASAPSFAQIWGKINKICASRHLVFYNSRFDKRMMVQSANAAYGSDAKFKFWQLFDTRTAPHETTCVMRRYVSLTSYYRWQTLINACNQQGIKCDDVPNHRAAGDAIKTVRLYKSLYPL